VNKAEEAAFERKADAHFRGHRGSPLGRDFRSFRYRFDAPTNDPDFKSRFDRTFPDAPGSPNWFQGKFGGL